MSATQEKMQDIERWGVFEIALEGPREGNPFVDVELAAICRHGDRRFRTRGFYDGEGVYRVRCMPGAEGAWSIETESDCPELSGRRFEFRCVAALPGNRGPVRVADRYHFAYADGSRHVSVGTTCYAWVHQSLAMQEQTLETLGAAPFNKLRMCVFPKNYQWCKTEPEIYPYEKNAHGEWDFARFYPPFFRHFEERVRALMEMGIEADIILFHPYDFGRWGFDQMRGEEDDRYLRYIVARLAAFRNVWWSMANEFDLMKNKTEADWDRFFQIVRDEDPYGRLRSIHQCHTFYDHGKEWVTHASLQTAPDKVTWAREEFDKPAVVDETGYEGTVPHVWGNLSAGALVDRFWDAAVRGGYMGHGETYLHPEDLLWWSKGGVLRGESPPRIAFLRQILEDAPPLEPLDIEPKWDNPRVVGRTGEYYLQYFGNRQPGYRDLNLPEDAQFRVDLIDTWNMEIIPVEGTYSGKCSVHFPKVRPYLAMRIRKA